MQHCPNCGGGELKIIAAILERPVIEKILTHLGLRPDVRVRKDSHACRRPGRDFTRPGWILKRHPWRRRARRGGLELAAPHPRSHQDDAASGRNGGLEPRAWAVLGVACVRRPWHQGEP
jgi:hypothetical protein